MKKIILATALIVSTKFVIAAVYIPPGIYYPHSASGTNARQQEIERAMRLSHQEAVQRTAKGGGSQSFGPYTATKMTPQQQLIVKNQLSHISQQQIAAQKATQATRVQQAIIDQQTQKALAEQAKRNAANAQMAQMLASAKAAQAAQASRRR